MLGEANMATRKKYFPGRELPWLEERLQELQEDEASGKVNTSWGMGDSNSSSQTSLSIDERKRRLLNDLSLLDPDKYPPADNIQISRTQIRFHPNSHL